MVENETLEKKESNSAKPSKDDALLRSEREIVDKTIGSEGQNLAEKRLAALKRTSEMPSG
jgi:hypothetical protein